AAFLVDLGPPYPDREISSGALLHDALALDSIGIALQIERSSFDVGQHGPCHPFVVGRQIGLGDPAWEQGLSRPRDLDAPAPRLNRGAHRFGSSLTTSRVGLSYRSP